MEQSPLSLILSNRLNLSDRLIERFLEKVNRNGEGGCWIWTGWKSLDGYGKIGVMVSGKSTQVSAHRMAYELSFGALSRRHHVHHLCNRRACVNPLHLQALLDTAHGALGASEKYNACCSMGHPLTADNVIVGALGKRLCVACNATDSAGANPRRIRQGIELSIPSIRINKCCGLDIRDGCQITNEGLRRFASKVNISDGCWEWTGLKNRTGYGYTSYHHKNRAAHRLSYQIFKGDTPSGMQVHHICENRVCVNPDHLLLVTAAEHNTTELAPNSNATKNRLKTHCAKGHKFGESNGRRRVCLICQADNMKARRHELRSENPLPEQTHCKHGHEFTEENTRMYQGKRICKKCNAERTNAYYHMKRENPDYTPSVMGPERTHCRRGHALAEANVYLYRGVKMCRECRSLNLIAATQRRSA